MRDKPIHRSGEVCANQASARVKALLQEGLSQAEVARRIGVSRQRVHQIVVENDDPDKAAEAQRIKIQRRREQGRCITCGRVMTPPVFATCGACRGRVREWYAKHRREVRDA